MVSDVHVPIHERTGQYHQFECDLGGGQPVLDSIVVSIPACHAGDRGSIPRRGGTTFSSLLTLSYTFIYSKTALIRISGDQSNRFKIGGFRIRGEIELFKTIEKLTKSSNKT